jgi:hypothetical protein
MDDETYTVDEAFALKEQLVRAGVSRKIRLRPDSVTLGMDPDIRHVDSVAWHDAPLPPADHDCFVQTSGWIGLTQYCRCACGAVCNRPEKGYPAESWHWMERNQRRQHGETG